MTNDAVTAGGFGSAAGPTLGLLAMSGLHHRRMFRRRITFSEMATIFAVIGVLSFVFVPVLVNAMEAKRFSTCLSNMGRVGEAILLYAQDNNEAVPSAGWAGPVAAYARSKAVFRCPSDATRTLVDPGAATVSYGINSNLEGSLAAAAGGGRTVLLFEVSGSKVHLDRPGEGGRDSGEMVSPAGNGANGGLVSRLAASAGRKARYATGLLDNAGEGEEDFGEPSGRHRGGSNFLSLDGRGSWCAPSDVSAGASAADGDSEQIGPGERGAFPVAEGSSVGRHSLTFSSQ